MATYFLNLKTFGRSNGSSAPGAAAYRAGERIRDERTGRTYDHTDRQDVLHKEILVPSEYGGVDMGWAKDRANLWNAAEAAESRKNARVAREYLVALPAELDVGGRVGLAREFAQELADRYRFAVDVTVHAPRDFPGSDPRNFHAHLLATTREVDRNGLRAKTTFELNESARRALGLGPSIDELLHVRERWAMVTNEALREANVEARIDHRTLRAQGIDREPRLWIPKVAYEVERRGFYSPVAERIRADHQAREQARRDQSLERPEPARAVSPANSSRLTSPPREEKAVYPPTLADMQRQARENWLRVRQQLAERPKENETSRGHDDDLSR
jgi:ATP-dependent exoDNAse (exonuclease V) alpha subunit